MDNGIVHTGTQAASKLLDSGHLAVTIFMLLICILGVWIWWLSQALKSEREYSRTLEGKVRDLQTHTLTVLDRYESLLKRLANER